MNQTNDVAISLKSVKKSFQDKPVLKGVNIEVKRGSIYALLGSNGAGKTTLIKIMTTLLKQDEGEVMINGFDVQKEPFKAKKSFALTGQFAATDESLTGRNNLQIIGELNHLKDIHKKIDDLLMIFDLSEVGNKAVNTYSGGMRRRLDIAMSILSKPSIIFLDEPTTGLDPQNRSAMWNLIKSLADEGTTIFLTTQYLEEAEVLADYVAILHDGIIVRTGTPIELKKTLPQGIMEFTFQKSEELISAKTLLHEFRQIENNGERTLTIVTDGSMEQLSSVFNMLTKEKIEVSTFTQKLPSLEDVFYTIINESAKEA